MTEPNPALEYWNRATLTQRYRTVSFHVSNGMSAKEIAAVYGSTEGHIEAVAECQGQASGYVGDISEFYSATEVPPLRVEREAREIIRIVADKHGLTLDQIKARRRLPRIVKARQEAMYRLYRDKAFSLTQIARRLGDFDHTTVLHGIRRHAERTGAPDLVPRKGAR